MVALFARGSHRSAVIVLSLIAIASKHRCVDDRDGSAVPVVPAIVYTRSLYQYLLRIRDAPAGDEKRASRAAE